MLISLKFLAVLALLWAVWWLAPYVRRLARGVPRTLGQHLAAHSIPSPTRLVADMLALRVAGLPPAPYNYALGCLSVQVTLSDDRRAEIKSYDRVFASSVWVKIYPSGGGSHTLEVVLASEDCAALNRALSALYQRTKQSVGTAKEAEKQQDALTLLESML